MSSHSNRFGVEIIGSGQSLPESRLTNTDLEACMDTSSEWIIKRTGIHERRQAKICEGERTSTLSVQAITAALADANIDASELDLLLVATMTPDSPTPSIGCIVADRIGAGHIGAMDINAACSGFVFTLSMAESLIKAGGYRTIGVIGADTITRFIEYSTAGRGAAILFGDGAGAMILRRSDDPTKGLLAHRMHSDGDGGKHLFIPTSELDFPEGFEFDQSLCDRVQMNGKAVFKFAVNKFQQVIADTLDDANLEPDDVDHYVCHQANLRILESARERFGIPKEKLLVNIDRLGNTVAGSVPLVFAELKESGKLNEGDKVMFLAFGAGLTWGSSLWQL
ncbi:MAG: beta-ketoacyl-ACP synthase III [Phycisphaerales bacterium]